MPESHKTSALFAEFLGPIPETVPLAAQVVERIACDGYVREKVTYAVSDDVRVSAYVCSPEGSGPFPAVFCHHQHAGDFSLGKSEPVGLAGDPDQAYAAELARKGFVTITPDAIGFEERNWSGDGSNVTVFELSTRLVRGETLLATCLHDISVAINYLLTRAEVDAGRIGFLGHSYGGRAALWAPAYDHRIRASVSNCGCIPYRHSYSRDTGVQSEFVLPGFAAEHDLEDLFSYYSSDATLLISAGTEDKWSRGYAEVYAGAREALGDRAELAVYSMGHRFTAEMRRRAYGFLTEHLAG